MNTVLDAVRYIFHPIPGSPFQFYIPILIISGSLLALGIWVHWIIRKHRRDNKAMKRLFSGIPASSYWFAGLLLGNLLGRYERFPLLGSRFVLYGTILLALYTYGKALYRYIKIYPLERERFRETPAQKKYTIEKYSHR